METLLAFVIGALYASGLYLMLRRSTMKIVIGLALLTNATNLLIFTSAGLVAGAPPLIADTARVLEAPYADPLPQALILTAIVIGFGVQAFALVLVYRAFTSVGEDDVDAMRTTEEAPESMEVAKR